MTNQFFPFGPAPGNSGQAYLPYDLIINEDNPGIILEPTEANGVVTVFREVGGVSWWVLNADYNTDDAQWEQVSPSNAALPAYALAQSAGGAVTRYTAIATNTPGTAVAWVPVWTLDAKGNMAVEPLTGTAAGQIASAIDVTWNAGEPAVMNVREINLTDTSSNSSSWLDNLSVNGAPVWQVRKDGTLLTGIIPFANVTGFTLPPDQTLTGTTTFTGPAIFEDGLHVTAGTATFDGPVVVNDGLDVTGGETVDDLTVTDTATINHLNVTGSASLPAGAVPVQNITGSGGVVVTNSGTTFNADGSALVETITSTGGTVTISRTGQTIDLEVGSGGALPYVQGMVRRVSIRPVTGGPFPLVTTLTLPTLPGTSGDHYQVYASAFSNTNTGGYQKMHGSGATWESDVTADDSIGGPQPIDLNGTAVGGQTPSVDYTISNEDGAAPYNGVFQLFAYPVP